jgi:hypothetical protein
VKTWVSVASDEKGSENSQLVGNRVCKGLVQCRFLGPGKKLPAVRLDPRGIRVFVLQALLFSLGDTATAHE